MDTVWSKMLKNELETETDPAIEDCIFTERGYNFNDPNSKETKVKTKKWPVDGIELAAMSDSKVKTVGPNRLQDIAKSEKVSVRVLMLAWVLANLKVNSVIRFMSRSEPDELHKDVEAVQFYNKLTEAATRKMNKYFKDMPLANIELERMTNSARAIAQGKEEESGLVFYVEDESEMAS